MLLYTLSADYSNRIASRREDYETDCDLLGLPLRVVVGAKALAQGSAEVRHRRAPNNLMVPLKDLVPYLKGQIAQEQHD